jgi:ligand-binding sensor domain-containing protein
MCYFKEKSVLILFIFLISAIFIARPQFAYSQIDPNDIGTDVPSVVQTSPGDGDTGVAVNSSIEVLFSEFMDTFYFSLYNPFSISPYVDGTVSWVTDQTLIFSPAMLLDYNETYEVTIGKEAKTTSGISLDDDYEWSFVTESSPWLSFDEIQDLSLDQNTVKLILSDDNGDIWVVLASSPGASDDIFVFDGYDESDFEKIDESLGQINALEQDSTGNIWIASESGVHMYDGTDWTHHDTSTNTVFLDNDMKCLTVDSSDNIWVGSENSGMYKFDGTSWTNFNTNNSDLSSDWIIAIEADENDDIWFATPFGGIEGFDQTTWTSYKSTIEALFGINLFVSEIVAGSGSIWAATDLGLLKYDIASDQWELFTQIDGTFSQLNSISIDTSNDTVWVGTDTGLVKFDGAAGTGESIVMGDVGPAVQETAVDINGNAWIGTNSSLSRYDASTPVLLDFSPSNGKTNVAKSTKIILTFSEPMNKDSVISALSFSPSVSFDSSMNASSTKLTITPKSNLNEGKKYTVTLGQNAIDKHGRKLNQSTSWSFTTKKSTTPQSYVPPSYFGSYIFSPSTSFGFPTTSFTFPTATAFRFPTTSLTFPGTSAFRFPTTSLTFPGTSAFRFPTTSWTSSPFSSFGNLVYPRF